MTARMWHGRTKANDADEYFGYLCKSGVPDYRRTPGNRGAWVFRRIEGDVAHFNTLTFWESREAIKAFSGDDIEVARYYPEDKKYLLEFEPSVTHYEVYSDSSPDSFKSTRKRGRGDENMIARVWLGVVPIEKAEAYSRYLADFGFRDYQGYSGNRGVHLLRRTEGARVHFLFLSFWNTREAIVGYAGSDIEQAHYYPYDLECLIEPALNVEHYEVLSGPVPGAG